MPLVRVGVPTGRLMLAPPAWHATSMAGRPPPRWRARDRTMDGRAFIIGDLEIAIRLVEHAIRSSVIELGTSFGMIAYFRPAPLADEAADVGWLGGPAAVPWTAGGNGCKGWPSAASSSLNIT